MLGSGNSSYSWVALYSSSHTLPYLAASPIPRWPPLQDGTLHQHGGGAAAPTAGGVAVGSTIQLSCKHLFHMECIRCALGP